jgi:hypothetical protein
MQQYANQSVAHHLRGKAKFAFSVSESGGGVFAAFNARFQIHSVSFMDAHLIFCILDVIPECLFKRRHRCIRVGYGTQKRKLPP